MDDKTFNETIDLYIEDHWGEIVDDIARMVEVPSFEELDDAAPNAPFGPGPRAALSQILAIADRMGFATTDVDGSRAPPTRRSASSATSTWCPPAPAGTSTPSPSR